VRGPSLARFDHSPRHQNGHAPQAAVPGVGDPLAGGELGLITRDVVVRTGAETGLLAVWNGTDKLMDVICAWGGAPIDDGPPPIPAGWRYGFVGRVLETGHAAFGPIDSKHSLGLGIAASGSRLTHAAGAAVRPPGHPPGVLCVGFAAPPREDPAVTLWVLERYAGLAALCLHDAGALEGLLEAGRLDGLTGLLNHAAIVAELYREIERSARHGRPLSCFFVDLDRFKHINERHGHLHGSAVLAEVAVVLGDGVRVGDTIGRYGGDEFIAILPDTDYSDACVLAERLRWMISTTAFNGALESLDASVGVTQRRPGSTVGEMLGAADDALRAAKRAGGGIVVGTAGEDAHGDLSASARLESSPPVRPVPPLAPAMGTFAQRANPGA
jgi:diguanylate cyclase (GGDEF)-like protein